MHTRHLTMMKTILVLLALSTVVACAKVAAPPVDLPAPITGRVEASAPSADGNTTVTGSAGAVSGDTTVMAVNEALAGAQTLNFLGAFATTAFAADESFPEICSEVGHACSVAASDGSFAVVLPASAGDSIAIGIIDPTSGVFISELLHLQVPQASTMPQLTSSTKLTDICAGQGLTGKAVAIATIPSTGEPIVLKQGSDTASNRLVFGTANTATIDIAGCHAHSLATLGSISGDIIVATSHDDKQLWTARYYGGELLDQKSWTLAEAPMHAAFAGDPQSILIAQRDAVSVKIAKISLTDGTLIGSVLPVVQNGMTVNGLTRSIALKTKAGAGGTYLGLLVADDGTPAGSFVNFFEAEPLNNSFALSLPVLKVVGKLPSLTAIVDAVLFERQAAGNTFCVGLINTAAAVNTVLRFYVYQLVGGIAAPLLVTSPVQNITWAGPVRLADGHTVTITTGNMRQAVISRAFGPTDQIVVSQEMGNIFRFDATADSSNPTIASRTWPAGNDVAAIAIDETQKRLFGVDMTTQELVPKFDLLW